MSEGTSEPQKRSRPRFQGADGELANLLEPHITGLKWLADRESMSGKQDAKELVKHNQLWQDLRKLQPNLCFTATQAQKAIEMCAQAKA
eukprot:4491854-Alexandrium_andersonii.AAC.1